MAFVDAADRHHRHEDLHLGDVARVSGEQRLDLVRAVGGDDEVDPASGDVDARQVLLAVDQFVDLGDDDAVAEGRGLDEGRGVLGVGTGVEVAVPVGGVGGDQGHLGDQVDEQPPVQLDVRVNGADLHLAVREQLGDAGGLGTGVGEVGLARDAVLEQVEVLGAGDRGDQ